MVSTVSIEIWKEKWRINRRKNLEKKKEKRVGENQQFFTIVFPVWYYCMENENWQEKKKTDDVFFVINKKISEGRRGEEKKQRINRMHLFFLLPSPPGFWLRTSSISFLKYPCRFRFALNIILLLKKIYILMLLFFLMGECCQT